MSGTAVCEALRDRFETIRQQELQRLDKKLRGLSPEHRAHVEAMTAHIIQAIARMPGRALAEGAREPDLDALVHLFELE